MLHVKFPDAPPRNCPHVPEYASPELIVAVDVATADTVPDDPV